MPQQLLDYSHVHAAIERVRCEGMAQQMRVDVLFQPRSLADRAEMFRKSAVQALFLRSKARAPFDF